MAISTVISFLRFPPRTVWYDNACNFYDSALLQIPFVLRRSLLVVDRFHCQGHTCNNQFSPYIYKSFRGQRYVAAAVMNAVMDRSVSFLRYLNGDNIKPYLRALFAKHSFRPFVKDDMR